MTTSLRSGLRRLASICAARAGAGYGRLARFLPPTRHDITKLAPNGRDTFFGYYDKTPFSGDGTRVLGLNLRADGITADVGYFDLRDGNRFVVVGETTTWSWQLGARLQWMPGRENDLIGYNRIVEGHCGFVVQNVRSGAIEASYGDAVFDVSPDGRHAIGLNFARLHRLRDGYGYGACADPTAGQLAPENDGLVLLDLGSGERTLLLSLKALRSLEPQESMERAEHYVNHLSFSPSGERFLFLHLWNQGKKRFSRPITGNLRGGDLFILERNQNMSHYAWKSARELLIHTSKRPSGTRFILFVDQTESRRIVGEDVLTEPGHPSYSPDGRQLIVDTYPDWSGRQRLLLCSSEGELVKDVGRFYSPAQFAGSRKCDLHPRWDRTGSRVCIDSGHEGRRAMYLIDLH